MLRFWFFLVSSFALSSRFSAVRKQSFGLCVNPSASEKLCSGTVHTGSVSACSDAVLLRGGDLIITRVRGNRGNSVN